MKTIIAEKPSVAREIARILGATTKQDGYIQGNGYFVTWAFGHLVSLALPEKYGIKGFSREALPIMPDNFILTPQLSKSENGAWIESPSAIKQLKIIDSLFEQSESIIVATDAGREGELIFRYIYSFLNCTKPFERLWISSLTDKAIKGGFSQLQDGRKFDNLYHAAKARSEADWLVGLNATQAISVVSQSKGYSLGRVQTPTLALISKRYLEHTNFVTEPYWVIKLSIDNSIPFCLSSTPFTDYATVSAAMEDMKYIDSIRIESVEKKQVQQDAPLLFDLTALQKVANIRFEMSAKMTLDIAQSLYEKKVITYPRTGSSYISEDIFEQIPELLKKVSTITFDKLNRRSVDDSKITDHHAIIPTGETCSLNEAEQKVYDLIYIRLIEAFSPACIKDITKITAKHNDIEFTAKGEVIVFAGWRGVSTMSDPSDDLQTSQLPLLNNGDICVISKKEVDARKTKPKPLYTEATLLASMENAAKEVEDKIESSALKEVGLGTPATRASIIEVLFTRQYVERKQKFIIPTEKGLKIYSATLTKRIADVGMTGFWESELDKIAKGEVDVESFNRSIRAFCGQMTQEILTLQTTQVATDVPFYECPICKNKTVRMYEKVTRCVHEGCEMKIFRVCFQKKLTDQQIIDLLTKQRTKVIKGFKSKIGKEFSAALVFNNGRIEPEFEKK